MRNISFRGVIGKVGSDVALDELVTQAKHGDGRFGGLNDRDRFTEVARSIMMGITVEYAQHLSGGRRADTMRLNDVLSAAVRVAYRRSLGLPIVAEIKPSKNDALINSYKEIQLLLSDARRGEGLFQKLPERSRMREFNRVSSNRLTLGFAKRLARSGYGERVELVNGLLLVQLFVKACHIVDVLVDGEPDSAAKSSR